MQSSELSASVGLSRIMPMFKINAAALKIKEAGTVATASNVAGFYTALESDYTDDGFDTATLLTVANQLDQEIVNTGPGKKGLLTHLKGVEIIAANQEFTFTVIADGVTTELVGSLVAGAMALCFGDFRTWPAQSGTISNSSGGEAHAGYTPRANRSLFMPTPLDTSSDGLKIGIPFDDSLIVKLRSDTHNLSVGSATNKAFAGWLIDLPEGAV